MIIPHLLADKNAAASSALHAYAAIRQKPPRILVPAIGTKYLNAELFLQVHFPP